MRTLIERLVTGEQFHHAARRMAAAIRAAGGVARAADVVEAQMQ